MTLEEDIKRLAGITEGDGDDYELHTFLVGNSRPFVSIGDGPSIISEVEQIISDGSEFSRMVIVNRATKTS